MATANTRTSSTRLTLGFRNILVLPIAVAVLGQIYAKAVQKRIQEITCVNASKTQLDNAMLASVNAMGIQSRSVVTLDAADSSRSMD